MSSPVSARSRRLDVMSVAMILLGGLCYGGAYAGMQALRAAPHDPNAPLFAGYTRYVRLTQLSYVGLAAVVVGVCIAVYAAVHARRERA